MRLGWNRGFSLIEVLIAVAILSTAIIFIFRSYAASLSASLLSQNITLACYLAEDKLWEIEQKQKSAAAPLSRGQGAEVQQARGFNWKYEALKLPDSELIRLELGVSWIQKAREKEYGITFIEYLLSRKQ